jgi:hypothetical protein
LKNRGPDTAEIHLLPTLWFRNTWSWDAGAEPCVLRAATATDGAAWAIEGEHPTLGSYHLYGTHPAELLFTENLSNAELLWGSPNASPYVKDASPRDAASSISIPDSSSIWTAPSCP